MLLTIKLSVLGNLREENNLFDITSMMPRVMYSQHQGKFDGTVNCYPACNGTTPCIASCTAENKAWNETSKGYDIIDDDTKIPFSEV